MFPTFSPPPRWGLPFLLAGLIAAIPNFAQAQKLDPPELRFKLEPNKTAVDLKVFELRPNTATNVAVYLRNPRDEALKDTLVKIMKTYEDRAELVTQAKVDIVAPNQEVRLTFPKGKEGDPGILLSGPPFQFQIWTEEGKKPVVKDGIDINIKRPSAFVAVTDAEYDKIRKRISVKLKLTRDFVGPRICPVQLVVDHSQIPGLKEVKAGAFKQIMTDDQEVELFAGPLEFIDEAKIPDEGRIHVNVDGYERAFTFTVTFKETGKLTQVTYNRDIGARLRLPKYTLPIAKFPVALEIDGPLDDARVELGLDRVGTKQYFQPTTFVGLRQQKIRLLPSSTGDLLIQTEVQDWKTVVDTADVYGNIFFRIQVFEGYQGKKLRTLARERIPIFQPGGLGGLAPLTFGGVNEDAPDQLFAEVILDPTPPEVKFVDLPKVLEKGKPLELKASLEPRNPIKQAPIESLIFLAGKPAPDGKILPEAILGAGVQDKKTGLFELTLPPPEGKDKIEVSVLATTILGLRDLETETVLLRDPPKVAEKGKDPEKKKLATITGTVTHGDRNQPGLGVVLLDGKGEPKGNTQTNDSGVYKFEEIVPGQYIVYTGKNVPPLTAVIRVTVPEKKEKVEADLKLKAR